MEALIVENNLELVWMLKKGLRGHNVDFVSNLTDARRLLAKNRYNVIFLDIHLNGESGLHLLPQNNVVIMSSECVKGMDCLKKPFTMKNMIRKINEYSHNQNDKK